MKICAISMAVRREQAGSLCPSPLSIHGRVPTHDNGGKEHKNHFGLLGLLIRTGAGALIPLV